MTIRPQIEVRDLLLVRAIFSEGTTGAAAKVLGVTQSGVSHQLRSLEQRLNLDVFQRKGRSLCITEAGKRMLTAGGEILQSLASLESELRAGADSVPVLRVATQCFTAYAWLPRAIVELRAQGSELRIKPVVPHTENLDQALLKDELDLVLNLGPVQDARLCQRRVFDDELVLVTSKEHRLASSDYVNGEDLKDEDLVVLEAAREIGQRVRRALFPGGGGFRSVAYLPLTEAIVEMVRAGLGVTILPTWAVGPDLGRGELGWARLTKRGLRRRWVGVYQRNSLKASLARDLLRVLKAQGPPPPNLPHQRSMVNDRAESIGDR